MTWEHDPINDGDPPMRMHAPQFHVETCVWNVCLPGYQEGRGQRPPDCRGSTFDRHKIGPPRLHI